MRMRFRDDLVSTAELIGGYGLSQVEHRGGHSDVDRPIATILGCKFLASSLRSTFRRAH